VTSDGTQADVDVSIVEPGKGGSLRGDVRARICAAPP
jgi:hypothetical protein